jgi:ParB family chromosome partitioning protein
MKNKEYIKTESEFKETRVTSSLLLVDPKLVKIKDGFNVRQDFGDLDELKNSIIENGQRLAIKGYKDLDGIHFILTDGERRLRAIRKAIEEGADIKYVKLELESKGYSEDRRTFDLLICNDGKKLLSIEEANVYQRLINFGYKPEEISKKTGKSPSYVYNMLKLANTPKIIQNMVSENKISANTVTILKNNL